MGKPRLGPVPGKATRGLREPRIARRLRHPGERLSQQAQRLDEMELRLRRALDEMVVGGIHTTLPLHQRLVDAKDVVDGHYDIHWLERFLADK